MDVLADGNADAVTDGEVLLLKLGSTEDITLGLLEALSDGTTDAVTDRELLDLKLWSFEAVIMGLLEALNDGTADAVTDGELLALLGVKLLAAVGSLLSVKVGVSDDVFNIEGDPVMNTVGVLAVPSRPIVRTVVAADIDGEGVGGVEDPTTQNPHDETQASSILEDGFPSLS